MEFVMIDKIKNWLIMILIVLGMILYISCSIKDSKLDKQSKKITELESKVENLKLARKADVAASKSKEKLKEKMDSSKDVNNLNHVPDVDVLMQLRSDPI